MIVTTMRSVAHALCGLRCAFRQEQNFRTECVFFAVVFGLCCWLRPGLTAVLLLSVCAMFVLTAELFNTCVEHVCDFVQPEQHESIKLIKDISAGAVLVSVLGSLIVATATLLPALLERVHHVAW